MTQRNIHSKRRSGSQGMALVFVVSMIVVLSVLFADLSEETTMSYVSSAAVRDSYQAELLASSMIDITRLLISLEPQINAAVSPILTAIMGGKKIPQLAMWKYGQMLVLPFCRVPFSWSTEQSSNWDGECLLTGAAENSKLNLNLPISANLRPEVKNQLANQLFALMDGNQDPSVYDSLFQKRDRDDNFTTRQDIVSAVIDWSDIDGQSDKLDLTTRQVSQSGGEDNVYGRLKEPYLIKNSPLNSVQELRLVRGFGEDFWVNFAEPSANDPESRRVTVYSSSGVNVNEAPPFVLLTTLCSGSPKLTLCTTPSQAISFLAALQALRQLYSSFFFVPLFSTANEFLDFVEGKGGDESPYKIASVLFPPKSGVLFAPVSIPAADRQTLSAMFADTAQIINLRSEVRVHNARAQIDSVVNFSPQWQPPPPNVGSMPPIGTFIYYRVQ